MKNLGDIWLSFNGSDIEVWQIHDLSDSGYDSTKLGTLKLEPPASKVRSDHAPSAKEINPDAVAAPDQGSVRNATDIPDGFSKCEFCGCVTNAMFRACCNQGRTADADAIRALPVDTQKD